MHLLHVYELFMIGFVQWEISVGLVIKHIADTI